METNKNYSLFSDQIEDAVAEYVAKDASLTFSKNKPIAKQVIYRLTKDGETGYVSFTIKKTGLVSINIQGKLTEECEKCCDYVISKAAIPNAQKKSFTIRKCIKENFEYFKSELADQHKLTLSAKDTNANVNISECQIVSDTNDVKVTLTLFKNNTFLMQGNVTPLFINVMTEAISWLMDVKGSTSVVGAISLENITNTFNTDIHILVPNLAVCDDTDGVISRMIMTSVAMFNSGVIVDDYGCYTFGLLKALEGLLKLRLGLDLGMIDKLGDHFHFDTITSSHKLNTDVYNGTPHLKVAINKTYNYWKSKRHASFHADAQIAVSTMYSYEQALEVGMKALDCINEICNNWV